MGFAGDGRSGRALTQTDRLRPDSARPFFGVEGGVIGAFGSASGLRTLPSVSVVAPSMKSVWFMADIVGFFFPPRATMMALRVSAVSTSILAVAHRQLSM